MTTIRDWCALIEVARSKHTQLTDAEMAAAICLKDEQPDELFAIIQKVNLYIQIRDEIQSDKNSANWDAEGIAEMMCDRPTMAEAFLQSKSLFVPAPERINVSETVNRLFSSHFVLDCVAKAGKESTAGAAFQQHFYHFEKDGENNTIVVTIGRGIPTSVMLPLEADDLRRALETVVKEKRAAYSKKRK